MVSDDAAGSESLPGDGILSTVKTVMIDLPEPGKLLIVDAAVESAEFNGMHTVTIEARSTDANADYLTQGTGRLTLIATG